MTTNVDVLEYLGSKGVDLRGSGEQRTMCCPACGDTKYNLGINVSTGQWICRRRNTCGLQGGIRKLRELLGDQAPRSTPEREYSTPDESPTAYDAATRDWFAKRGLTEDTMKRYRVGTLRDGKIGIPHYRNGKIVNMKKRNLIRTKSERSFEQTTGAQQMLYGTSNITGKEATELIIVEGEPDCMSVSQVGVANCVAVPNGAENYKWIDHDLDKLERFERIYLALHADAAGDRGSRKIADRLGAHRCYRLRPPDEDTDWNDYLVAGKLTPQWFGELAMRATDMDPDDVVTPEDILEELCTPDPQGLMTGLSRLDGYLGGLRAGEVTLVTGRSYTGKTVLTNQIALNILEEYDHAHVMLCSLELPRKVMCNWLCESLGMDPGRESYLELFKIFRRRVRIHAPREQITADNLLRTLDAVAKRMGLHLVIIDSLMCVSVPGEDHYEGQKDLMRQLNLFANQHECHVLMISHPRKGFSDASGVGLVDIAGSADLGNLSWNAISMNRIEKDEGEEYAFIKILKNRVRGIRGSVQIEHETDRRRFREIIV